MKKHFQALLLSIALIPLSALSKPNIMYLKPNAHAKILSTITRLDNIVIIETQGQWVRIFDPASGIVGWVQTG